MRSIILIVLVLAACEVPVPDKTPAAAPAGLSEAQLEHGIGPIEPFVLPGVNSALAAEGEKSFTLKCASCHQWDTRLVGPPLSGVLERRAPAFVMNVLLNPDEMGKKHPEMIAQREEYGVAMPNQFLSRDEARGILEYIRGK
ncbi:MAG: cytochrome c [Rhodothermales bacterium]|nr:cytochrome c [Rhodothermales bacterium]